MLVMYWYLDFFLLYKYFSIKLAFKTVDVIKIVDKIFHHNFLFQQ